MEIKILVKENEKAELDKFIETCKDHGMELTREGGGRLPNFSGYYAEFKGVRWKKDNTSERQSNIPVVSGSVLQQIRQASADYRRAEGCSSVEDIDALKEAEKWLAECLGLEQA